MEALLLARIQFAFTIGFHYLFPPVTIGLSLVIVIIEGMYLKTGEEVFKKASQFLIKILGLIFVVGVATGITMEFAFGTNWSTYSRVVGDIFGAPLAAEGIFAFFLESTFLGVMLFGRNKVSKKMYWVSTILVAFGSHLSGLWIIIANSFMQTPAGFEMVNGVAVMTNFFEAAINHSTLERYTHTIASAWLTGSLFSAGIGAWYLLKEKHVEIAKKIVHISLIVFIISGILQLFLGHAHAVQVAKTQPVKLAAFESQWETKNGASLSLFAIPDVENEKNYFEIGIPKLLSILVYFDPDAKVQGLKDFPKDERPPVFLVFAFYHIMIGLGTMFFFAAFLTIFMLWKGKVWSSKWFLKGLLFSIPLPHIATQTGWAAAEVGRQPWVVYNVLKTSDAVSKVVSAGEILFTLILLFATYSLIFYVFMRILLKIIKKGPEEISDSGY